MRDRPIVADTQLYFYMSERVAAGVPPHVSQVDIKTSLGSLISGLAIKVGRGFDLDDVTSGRIASIGSAALTVGLAFALTLELTGSIAAAAVAGAAMLTARGLFFDAVTGFSPKVFLTPSLLLTCLAASRRRWLLAGAVGAAAFLTWQPGAAVVLGCMTALAVDRRAGARDVVRFVAGGAAVLLAYESYFAWYGALGQQIHQELLAFRSSSRRAFDLAESAWFFFTESRAYQSTPNAVPVVFALVGAAVALFALVRPRRAARIARSSPGMVALWISAAVGTAFTFYDHQAHPDMLLVQPYFAVACGLGFAWLAPLFSRLPAGRALAAIAATAVMLLCFRRADYDARAAMVRWPTLASQIRLANLLDVYRDHRGSVWVVGAAHLLGLGHRDNHVPHAYLAGPITKEIDFASYRPLRDGAMPEVIAVSRGIIPGRTWLRAEYQEITPAAFARQRIRVYGRRQAGVSGPDPVAFTKAAGQR